MSGAGSNTAVNGAEPSPAKPAYVAQPELVNRLTEQLASHYPWYRTEPRKIGLRAQFPLCGLDGKAGDTGMLWPFLKGDGFEPYRESNGMQSALHGADFGYSVTAGRGVIEIQIPLCENIQTLHAHLHRAVQRLIPAANRWKKEVLTYGGQPATALTPECLTHKFHYFSLLRAIQEPYLYHGLQATNRFWVDTARSELMQKLNLGHLIAPLLNALTASTPIFANEDGRYPSSRWAHQAQLDESVVGDGRWQMVHDPYSDLDEWVFHTVHQPQLLLRDAEGWLNPGSGLFGEYAESLDHTAAEERLWTDYTDHLDTLWTAAQPCLNRDPSLHPSMQNVVGLQMAETEQMGIEVTLAVAALILGVMETETELLAWWETLVPDPPEKREFGLRPEDILRRNLDYSKDIWEPMRVYWRRFMKQGLVFPEPFFGCFEGLLAWAKEGLQRRGMGEEVYLKPLEQIIAQQLEPHREMRRTWILGGMEALVSALRIPEYIPSEVVEENGKSSSRRGQG